MDGSVKNITFLVFLAVVIIITHLDYSVARRRQIQIGGCVVQSCDQIITGRQLSYIRALTIVQGEEYLQAADLDLIRKKARLKRVASNQVLNYFNGASLSSFCEQLASKNLTVLATSECSTLCPQITTCSDVMITNIYTGQSVFFNDKFDCIAKSIQAVHDLCSNVQSDVAVLSTTDNILEGYTCFDVYIVLKILAFCLFFSLIDGIRTGAIGAGVAGAAGLAAFPEMPLVNNLNTPPGQPAPGTPGGGGLPATAPATVAALVPVGALAVAVFPPYETPRTFPADSVIFLENPGSVTGFQGRKRKKRSILRYIRRLFNWEVRGRSDSYFDDTSYNSIDSYDSYDNYGNYGPSYSSSSSNFKQGKVTLTFIDFND